jgi:hypothetical protein
MEPEFRILSSRMPLLTAVAEIIKYEVVLVHDDTPSLTGIITTTDLSIQLRALTDAFLLVGNIERQLRRLLRDRFTLEQLRQVANRRPENAVNSVDDLTFGEYVRLLQVAENWDRLNLKVDQRVVLQRLNLVRQIRNDVMHFRSTAADDVDIDQLHQTEQFLASLSPREPSGS